ncbi:hypothetical protein Tco_0012505 [Tanacetum coccineum]
MLAPKGSTFNGRPTIANLMYLKKAQSEKSCLYKIPYDTSDLANRFTPDRQYTLNLKKESRSKLDKDLVKPYDYTKQNSFYENFKPASKEYHDQLAHANKYVESLEKGVDELESDKAEFSNMYDLLLQEYTTAPLQQELDLLFGPLYDEFFNEGTSSIKKSSSPTDNSKQQDTPPTMNIQSSTEPTTPTTTVNAEENSNNNQAEIQVDNEHVNDNKFYNVFSTPVHEEAESSSRYVDPSNMHTFYQPHQSEHRWIKAHPLCQVLRNPSKPVQTRQ